jgi:hypothetical protein
MARIFTADHETLMTLVWQLRAPIHHLATTWLLRAHRLQASSD